MYQALVLNPVAVVASPSLIVKRVYDEAPLKMAVLWYFIAITGGILLFPGILPKEVPAFFAARFSANAIWINYNSAIIVIYTIGASCLIFKFVDVTFVKVTEKYIGLFWLAVVLSFISLILIGEWDSVTLIKQIVIPTNPILQLGVSLLICAILITISFGTSFYIAAGEPIDISKTFIIDVTSSAKGPKFRANLIHPLRGTLSVLLLTAGGIFFIHRLILATLIAIGSSDLLHPNEVLPQALALAIPACFAWYISKFLEVVTLHAKGGKSKAFFTAMVVNISNILPHEITISLTWLLAGVVYRGVSQSGIPAGNFFGWSVSLLVSGLVWAFFMLVLSIFYYESVFWKTFWRVRWETLLLDTTVWLLHGREEVKILLTTIFESAKSASKGRDDILIRLNREFSNLYQKAPEMALDILAEVPTYIADDAAWLPILDGLYQLSKSSQIRFADHVFSKLSSAGVLQRVGPQLTTIPILFQYYQISTAKDSEFRGLLEKLVDDYRLFSRSGDLVVLYSTLLSYASLTTFNDIVNLSLSKPKGIDFGNDAVSKMKEPFTSFQTIITNLNKSKKVALEHKLPYYADSFEILNNILRAARDLQQPHQRILSKIAADWQSLITTELITLKGRAEIRIGFRLKQYYGWSRLTLPIEIKNTGNSVAEDIRIRVTPDAGQFKVLDFDFNEIDILPPGQSIIVNFNISTRQTGQIRVAVEAVFTDFEDRNKIHRFGDVIQVMEGEEKAGDTGDNYSAFMANPYIPGRPIQNPRMFFGRQDVIAQIEQGLKGRHQNNVIVLQGERRSGKTSILYYLANNSKEYISALIDAQGFLSRGTEYFFWQFAAAIQEELKRQGIELPVPDQRAALAEAEIWFRRDFLSSVKTSLNGASLLILFDEFDTLEDRIREGTLDKEVFPFFRSLVQHENWLAFVFSGTYRLEEMVTEYWSVLFNIAIYFRLGLLSDSDTRDLIINPVAEQFKYDEFSIERILTITSGHPYFVQLICFLIYNLHVREKKEYVTSQDVDRIIDEVIETQAHTHFIWKDSSRDERYVLSAMAQETRYERGEVSSVMIQLALQMHEVPLSQPDISDILAKLSRKGIITSDSTNSRFSFRVELIRRWLTRYKSLVSIIDESGR